MEILIFFAAAASYLFWGGAIKSYPKPSVPAAILAMDGAAAIAANNMH